MNTEQLKTAEQFLQESFERAKVKYPEENWKEFHEVQIEREFIGEAMQIFASQESKRAVDEALIDRDFIVYCLNQAWNYAHEQLQKKDLGDIEREIYQQQKDKAKALMTKLDS